MTKILPYSVARQNLASVMDEAVNSRAPITVTRRGAQPVVIMSLEEYTSMDETTYLTRNPANAAHLKRALAQIERGDVVEHGLIEIPDTAPTSPRRKRKLHRGKRGTRA